MHRHRMGREMKNERHKNTKVQHIHIIGASTSRTLPLPSTYHQVPLPLII